MKKEKLKFKTRQKFCGNFFAAETFAFDQASNANRQKSKVKSQKSNVKCQSKGFTLIETLIYVSILGMVAAGFIFFSVSISESRNKTYVVQEVQANARTALELISQKIRAANGVNIASSTFGTDPGRLSLSMASSTLNPTIIDLGGDDGNLRITEGLLSPAAATADEVKVTNLVFTDLAASSSRANIRVDMTVEYANPGGDPEYDYSQSWRTAVGARR